MKKLITLILILGLFSCETQEVSSGECYRVIDKELRQGIYVYTLQNDYFDKIVMSSVLLEIKGFGELELNEIVCNIKDEK